MTDTSKEAIERSLALLHQEGHWETEDRMRALAAELDQAVGRIEDLSFEATAATERAEKAEAEAKANHSAWQKEHKRADEYDAIICRMCDGRDKQSARVAAIEEAARIVCREFYQQHPLIKALSAALPVPTAPAAPQVFVDLASVPVDLKDTIRRMGAIEWGATEAKSAEEHAADTLSSVTKTMEHFSQTGDQQMHGCYLKGSELILCNTGTSPNSPNNARLIVGLWNWLLSEIERLDRAAAGDERGG